MLFIGNLRYCEALAEWVGCGLHMGVVKMLEIQQVDVQVAALESFSAMNLQLGGGEAAGGVNEVYSKKLIYRRYIVYTLL
jgi:hypothetical protein